MLFRPPESGISVSTDPCTSVIVPTLASLDTVTVPIPDDTICVLILDSVIRPTTEVVLLPSVIVICVPTLTPYVSMRRRIVLTALGVISVINTNSSSTFAVAAIAVLN